MENKQFPEFEEEALPQEQIQELPMEPEETVVLPQEEEVKEILIEEFVPEEEIASAPAEAPETDAQAPALEEENPSEEANEPVEEAEVSESEAQEPEIQEPFITEPTSPEDAETSLSEVIPESTSVADEAFRETDSDFDAMFQAEAQKAEPVKELPKPPRMAQKGRPKRKKGEGLWGIPNILVTVVWLALIVAIGVTAGRMLWVCAADVLAFGREDKPVTITIYEADSMEDIVDKLYDAGLIRYKSLFNLYAKISDAQEDIKPGIYDLNTRYDYHALVNFMSPSSSRQVVQLTIPEGYTCRQIFSLLEENRICTAVDLAAFVANGNWGDYWFLENVASGSENALEGFLFPDTYEFYKNSTPTEAITKMLDNFGSRFTEEMRAQIETLNADVTGGGYGVREVVIVASLIEKESAAPAESPAIAGVIYNRLFRWEFPALLNIDAAIIYAQGGNAEHIDTSLDSPYNTYLNTGLTPTPIANPGLSSLQAALNPEAHDYYYYVLNPSTGMHQFSTTQAEHDAWIAQFYNG